MSLRRGGAAVSVRTDGDAKDNSLIKSMSSTPTKTRRNQIVSGVFVAFFVGAYLMTLSSDGSTEKNKKAHSNLRASTAISTILPNFEPIHERCK